MPASAPSVPPPSTAEIGVCYYPEHWPEAEWSRDAASMREAGIRWVRIGEFAWSRIEPERGRFQFEWLDRAIETLGGAGLKVVLCTPTATPPKWLVDAMPDMLPVDANGNTRHFGSRRHYCFSHEGYLDECRRITRTLGERYGYNGHVAAWQTDNEYGCHDTALSYSTAALSAFRRWLEDRYGTIVALNAAWGTVFWSMEYRSFDEIDLPNGTVAEAHPSHALDFQRFSSDQVVLFNRAQTEILRDLSPGRPIGHNFMGRFDGFDHRAVGADLDFAAWDSYPVGFLQDMQEVGRPDPEKLQRFLRVGDPDFQAFHHDLYRGAGRGRWWVMEQQPGPVNWAAFNPVPAPGAVRLWGWEAVAHGAEVVAYFRWRQAPFAQEQMHAGLLYPDGSPAPGLDEASRLARELDGLEVGAARQAPVAIVHDYQASWMARLDGQTEHFSYLQLVLDHYAALRANGADIDVIGPDATLDGYRLVVVPALVCVPQVLADRLAAFNGEIVLGPRCGTKTEHLTIPDTLPPGPLGELAGFRSERADALPRDVPIAFTWNNVAGAFRVWRELGMATGDVEAETADGHPAIVRNNNAVTLTGWGDPAFLNAFMAGAMERAGLDPVVLPNGLRCRSRGDLRIFVNYGPEPARIPSAFAGEFLIGDWEVDAAGVAVMRG